MFTAPAIAPPAAPNVVHAVVIARTPDTLAPGTRVPAGDVGVRTFLGPDVGVALGGVDSTSYPVLSTDGGRVWRINGPALYTDSADAPLAVASVTAATRQLQYTTGEGGNVIDVTSDGGRVWRRATFPGVPITVWPGYEPGAPLVAFVQDGTDYRAVRTDEYVSRDGGQTWRYSTTLEGGRP